MCTEYLWKVGVHTKRLDSEGSTLTPSDDVGSWVVGCLPAESYQSFPLLQSTSTDRRHEGDDCGCSAMMHRPSC